MKEKELKLRKTEIEFLLNLVNDNIEHGYYYGIREQFLKRQNELKIKLENLLKN